MRTLDVLHTVWANECVYCFKVAAIQPFTLVGGGVTGAHEISDTPCAVSVSIRADSAMPLPAGHVEGIMLFSGLLRFDS